MGNLDNWVKPFTEDELMDHANFTNEKYFNLESGRSDQSSSVAPSRIGSKFSCETSIRDVANRDAHSRRRSGKPIKRKMYLFVVEVSRSSPLTEVEDGFFLHDGTKYLKMEKNEKVAAPHQESKHVDDMHMETKDLDNSPQELSLAREIVVLHGGSVFWSSKGKITSVGFSIPYEVVNGVVSSLSV